MAVQIVIIAPNQNVDDYSVNCSLEWTIHQLKEHLAKSYPSKPKVKEQKLIYSGRLLLNHLRLKDILRQEDSDSSVHNLHLVCSSDSSFIPPSQVWGMPEASPPVVDAGPSTSNTVRQRNVTTVPTANPMISENPAPQAAMPAQAVPENPMAAQYAAMQQMYSYYFSHYFQNSYNPGTAPAITPASNPPTQAPDQASDIFTDQEPVIDEEPVQYAQEMPLDDDIPYRDWIDRAFQLIRFMMLFMLLYCYATPEKLGMVLLCIGIALIYHEGWLFDWLNRNLPGTPAPFNPHRGFPNAADLADYESSDEEQVMVDPDYDVNEDNYEGEYELEATMDGDDPPHAQQQSDDANNNHIFTPLNFLSTFFASLIPDPPPPPINVN